MSKDKWEVTVPVRLRVGMPEVTDGWVRIETYSDGFLVPVGADGVPDCFNMKATLTVTLTKKEVPF